MDRTSIQYPIAFGIAVIGGLLITVSTFLPIAERSGPFAYVQENSAIQHGGWIVAMAGIGVIYHAYITCTGKRKAWWLVVIAVIAAGFVFWMANNESLRTLYPLGPDGSADASAVGVVAPAGIAAYVGGLGALLAVVGGVILVSQEDSSGPKAVNAKGNVEDGAQSAARVKKCPDCAETVLNDARVCKHCGYRFAPESG